MSFNAYENVATQAQADAAIALAEKHLLTSKAVMWSSGAYSLSEAKILNVTRGPGFAHEWSLNSLAYSVGILHPDYQAIKAESRASK